MKKIFSLIFAGGLTISSLSAQEKLNVLYVGGSANIETFGTRDLDPAAVAASARNALPISSNFSGSTSPK